MCVSIKKYAYIYYHCSLYSTFYSNSAPFGVVFASRNTIGFQGITIFNGNVGPAVQVLLQMPLSQQYLLATCCMCLLQSFGSLVHFSGDMMFSENRQHSNGFSGVINLAAFGQIMLESGANISFINNTGMYVSTCLIP